MKFRKCLLYLLILYKQKYYKQRHIKYAGFEKSFDIRVVIMYTHTVTVREVLKLLHNDGWLVYEQSGSHIQLKHLVKKGRVTVPNHRGDIKKGTLHRILKQAGLE